jgi:hypothetical protein
MAGEPVEEWREPTPVTSDDEGSSSDESTSYEEVVSPLPEKKHRTEEDEDLTYTPMADCPSTRDSRTPQWEQVDDEDHISKLLIQS